MTAAERRSLLVIAVLAAIAIVLALPRGRHDDAVASAATPSLRVGLVFDVGGRGDKSFNDAAWAGVSRARDELGAAVEIIEPTGSEDREGALRLFAARGFDLVLGVGFLFSRDIDAVARDYPKVRFACIDYAPPFDGSPIPPNVTGLAFREEQGAFLVGAVAALTSKTHQLGFVGGMDIPLIHKFEAGYRAGAAKVCPSCVVHVAYAGTTNDAFRDPAKGKAIALSQIDAGCDVLFHASGSTGHGVFVAAIERNVLGIGVDSDQYDEAPKNVLTSMVKRADVAVFDAVKAAHDHALSPGMRVLGLREGGVDYVHEGAHAKLVRSDVNAVVGRLGADIIAGAITVPTE